MTVMDWSVMKRLSGIPFLSLLVLGLSVGAQAKVEYTLHKSSNPTADEQDAYKRITTAVDSAVYMYNKYTHLSKHINVYYAPGVPTAEASSNGDLRFGENRSYMNVRTAMHEMGHTMGMGTTSEYRNMFNGNVFAGPIAQAKLKELTGDPTAELHGDSQHFWPYGLNYDSELHSEQDLIIHCQIVEAMYQDIFKEKLYMEKGKLVSAQTRTCIGMDSDNSLKMMDCADDATTVRIVEMGEDGGLFRFEYGDRVIDVPNESTAAGVTLGTYFWNSGAHQKYSMETAPTGSMGSFFLRNQKSKLYVAVSGENLVQENMNKNEETAYTWILLDKSSVIEDEKPEVSDTTDIKDSTDAKDSSTVEVDTSKGPDVVIRRVGDSILNSAHGIRFDAKGRTTRQNRKQAEYLKLYTR